MIDSKGVKAARSEIYRASVILNPGFFPFSSTRFALLWTYITGGPSFSGQGCARPWTEWLSVLVFTSFRSWRVYEEEGEYRRGKDSICMNVNVRSTLHHS